MCRLYRRQADSLSSGWCGRAAGGHCGNLLASQVTNAATTLCCIYELQNRQHLLVLDGMAVGNELIAVDYAFRLVPSPIRCEASFLKTTDGGFC